MCLAREAPMLDLTVPIPVQGDTALQEVRTLEPALNWGVKSNGQDRHQLAQVTNTLRQSYRVSFLIHMFGLDKVLGVLRLLNKYFYANHVVITAS